MYINCHTYYSLRYGAISEEELLSIAKEDGASTVALTDVNNTSACLNFVRLAQKIGIKPVLGIDFRDGARQLYLGLAKNNNGFYQLNAFLSHHLHAKKDLPSIAPELEDVFFIYPYERIDEFVEHLWSEDEYIGVRSTQIGKLIYTKHYDQYGDRMVALNSFTFRNKRDFNTHRLLRAIDNNVLLSKLEIHQQASETDQYVGRGTLIGAYTSFPDLVNNTDRVLEECEIDFDFSPDRDHQNKVTYTGSMMRDSIMLDELCAEGLTKRYKVITEEIRRRLDKEVEIIKKMQFVPFFLVNWDIISYAKRKGYFHVGRGSGANSIVAYILGITDVDPIELDLYFERFMNLYRTSPPDFDIDFSWRDREDVTRYIFERFGEGGQVALLATYNTFKHSAAVRELGKVFGLPKHEIDKLSDGKFDPNRLDKLSRLVLIYAQELNGRPNYLSIHAGGILISQRPIHYFTATNLPPKGFPTTQFDMVVAEDVGLYKYDILGQRGLGKIKDAMALVRINHPEINLPDIHDVQPFFVDPNINDLVRKASCIGCFYVESPAMRMLLKKLECDDYLGLVAASSIIRPGVSKSGMMREYILRHKYPERRGRAHPVMAKIMPETYGVMVYQEDVIKVAHYFAGLTLAEADVLRRGMSGKYRSREEFAKAQQKFIDNCRAKGYPDEVTFEVWRQTESFAGYAFAKGHSASYAVESYQSLYLKTYFPLEYMVAVINNGGGFYRTEIYVHEARRCGGQIEAPCINHSHYPTWIEGATIYLGFSLLHGLDADIGVRIVHERKANGLYQSVEDFVERVGIGIEQFKIIASIDAFRSTGCDKRSALWKGYRLLNKQPKDDMQRRLFTPTRVRFDLPTFNTTILEDAFDQIELLGYPLCHPFLLLLEPLKGTILLTKDLPRFVNKTITIYGYLTTVKNTTTSNRKRMQFGTFLDFEGEWLDTVHFPPVAKRYPFRGKGIYKLTGKVTVEFDFHTLEVTRMERMAYIEDPRFAGENLRSAKSNQKRLA